MTVGNIDFRLGEKRNAISGREIETRKEKINADTCRVFKRDQCEAGYVGYTWNIEDNS